MVIAPTPMAVHSMANELKIESFLQIMLLISNTENIRIPCAVCSQNSQLFRKSGFSMIIQSADSQIKTKATMFVGIIYKKVFTVEESARKEISGQPYKHTH